MRTDDENIVDDHCEFCGEFESECICLELNEDEEPHTPRGTMNRDKIMLLSLWQPWATLCIARDKQGQVAKVDETRSWRPPEEQLPLTIAIHATQKWDRVTREAAERFSDILLARGYAPDVEGSWKITASAEPLDCLPLGQIIGVAVVSRVIRTENIWEEGRGGLKSAVMRTKEQLSLGDYSRERFAWELSEQYELPMPVPFRGKQSKLYQLTGNARAEVREQL